MLNTTITHILFNPHKWWWKGNGSEWARNSWPRGYFAQTWLNPDFCCNHSKLTLALQSFCLCKISRYAINIVICSAEWLNEHHTTQYLLSTTPMIICLKSEETLLNFLKQLRGCLDLPCPPWLALPGWAINAVFGCLACYLVSCTSSISIGNTAEWKPLCDNGKASLAKWGELARQASQMCPDSTLLRQLSKRDNILS